MTRSHLTTALTAVLATVSGASASAADTLTVYSGDFETVAQGEVQAGGPGFALVERHTRVQLRAGDNEVPLAGLPRAVVKRAGEVLARLEKNNRRAGAGGSTLEDLPLFAMSGVRPSGSDTSAPPAKPSPVEITLAAVKPDELSPKAALELVYRLKELAAKETGPKC